MSAARRAWNSRLAALFSRGPRRTPEPDEGGYVWDVDFVAVQQSLHSPHEFVSARGDVELLAENEVRRRIADMYEGLPGERGGLTAAAIGAGTATAFFAVMGTLWFVLPAVLAVVFVSVFFWAGGSRRPPSAHRRVTRTRG
ncbi:hypothetical protein [Streptomyces cinereospinus]|uniref:DUF1707 domain-containing protein n=1 Tax=Streptomyces cinereospinus TaxID=285561 RepID=A0ABV5N2P7_9ACTN